MAGFFSEVVAKLRLDMTQFERGAVASTRALDGIDKMAKKVGLSFGGFAIFTQLMGDALSEAQRLRDEAEKLGKPIDNATASMARFADSLASVKNIARDSVGFVVGRMTQLGEEIGMGASILLGNLTGGRFGARDQNEFYQRQAAERAAVEQERRLAELRKQYGPEAVKKAEEQLAATRRSNNLAAMSAQERYNYLLAETTGLIEEAEKMNAGTPARLFKEVEIAKSIGELQRAGVEVQRDAERERQQADKAKQDAAEKLKREQEAALKLDKQRREEAMKLARAYYDAVTAVSDARANLAKQMSDRISATLGELAEGAGTQTQRARALEIQRLEAQARRQNLTGFAELAAQSQQRALELRRSLPGLTSGEREPFSEAEKAILKSEEHLAEIAKSLEPQNIS